MMCRHNTIVRLLLPLLLSLWSAELLPQGKTTDVATCVKALRDKDARVRLEAVNTLAELGPGSGEAIPYLIQALDDVELSIRWGSAVALGRIGPAALPSLMQALENEHANVRLGSAVALGRMGVKAEGALHSLIRALKDPLKEIRGRAAEALGQIGPEAGLAPLIGSFSDQDPFVNGKAAEAVSRIGKEAVQPLVRALHDENDNVRWCAAIALGKMGPDAQEAVPSLARALKDRNANVRWCSAVALGNVGRHAGAAVPALISSLADEDEDVRWGASMALEEIDPSALEALSSYSSIVAAIDSVTPRLMRELHVPGLSIALIRNRGLVWSRSFGVTDARQPSPVTNETLFEACSMSKPVFAYSVMKLVELGKLDLDRPLVDYLEESSLRNQPYHNLITARMVLSHTTGLPNWRKGEEERDGPLPVKFKPGSKFSYSGEGMFYLQRVVEQITGEPLELYAKRSLFEPLGLKRTTYVWTGEVEAHLASGHDSNGTFLQKSKYTNANAAYTLYTTAEEYAKFLVEIMNPDRSAGHSLSQRSIDTMLSRQVKVDVREPIERPGKSKGTAVYWGLGWAINATGKGDIIHHSGANRTGFRCFSQFSPGQGSGIVIMTNGIRGGDLWSRLINEIGDL